MSWWTPKRSSVAAIASRIRFDPGALERLEVVGAHPLGGELARQLLDVGALVAVLGRVLAAHPRRDRLREAPHLRPTSLT